MPSFQVLIYHQRPAKNIQEKLGFPSYEVDLTKKYNADVKFDAAIVIGGLHHCISDLRNDHQ